MHCVRIIHGVLMHSVGIRMVPMWIMHGLCMDYARIPCRSCMEYAWIYYGLYVDACMHYNGLGMAFALIILFCLCLSNKFINAEPTDDYPASLLACHSYDDDTSLGNQMSCISKYTFNNSSVLLLGSRVP